MENDCLLICGSFSYEVFDSSEPIYRRSSSVTNFRVKVYRNGENSRYAHCKSCSMDIVSEFLLVFLAFSNLSFKFRYYQLQQIN